MLYILPPLTTQNSPAPWSGIICSNNATTNGDRTSWNENKRPPRVRLRNLQIVNKIDDEKSGNQDELDSNRNPKSLSECYFAGKGTALVLPDAEAQKSSRRSGAQGSSNIQKHLQSMFYLLRPEETLKMAVKLESVHPSRTRYLVVVSRMGARSEESCLLGIDCNEKTTVGLVLKVFADTKITLDGDGGFSVSVCDRHHIFKPVSVQAMWSALQTLHKVSDKAREHNYFQGGMNHGWVTYYENRIESDRSCLNEWHAMDNLESKRPPSPDSVRTKPTAREETETVIRTTLKEIMMSVDLDEVTSKVIRSRLEEELDMDLGEYKSFIDQEMLVILGQMDAPTEVFDHVYLGSEWNASNYEELQRNGVGHILNVTREIDNFFPGTFDYLNVRVYDDEKTDLLKHWDDTFKYITKAKDRGSKVLVHCKMGVSRSASVVIAYAMKAYNWDFNTAMLHVKEKRSCIKPNTSFLSQLETYQGMLVAMKNKEKLQRSKSETNLKSPGKGAKNGKVLVGSEPTPVVQALSKSYDLQATMSGQDLRQYGARPKSWSPDNLHVFQGSKSSPLFLSLEDISQKSSSKESVKSSTLEIKSSLARHVLMPCDNGESYSVSPNQIVHLPGNHSENAVTVKEVKRNKKLVLNLSTKFESAEEQNEACDSSSSINNNNNCAENSETSARLVKQEVWDPGDQPVSLTKSTSDMICDSVSDGGGQTVWTSSAVLKNDPETICAVFSSLNPSKVPAKARKDTDPFSNQLDRVFDREEKRQQRISAVEPASDDKGRECPSRQSSWSSIDSAVVLGFQNENNEVLSRHSSWGSGDTRTLPSRNSSWGSYDMRPRGPVHYVNEKGEKIVHELFESSSCGIFPYDKEDIPWHPGTVKRTKQKIEECGLKKDLEKSPSSETLLFDLVGDDSKSVEVENASFSAISDKIDIPKDEHKQINLSRLSVSAPEPSSIELVPNECSLSRSASNVSNMLPNGSVVNTAQCSSVKMHRTYLENLQKDMQHSKKSDDLFENSSSGKVRNLKKEFEAKSSTKIDQCNKSTAECIINRVSSLPSSPVSVHVDKDKSNNKTAATSGGDDLNLKNLIGIFESQNLRVNLRQKNNTNKLLSLNRSSCIEDSSSVRMSFLNNLNKNCAALNEKSEGEFKRPPIVPVVRNASPSLVATVIAKANKKKQQQQYGKSHPLAMLNIRPHNNPVYNTM